MSLVQILRTVRWPMCIQKNYGYECLIHSIASGGWNLVPFVLPAIMCEDEVSSEIELISIVLFRGSRETFTKMFETRMHSK